MNIYTIKHFSPDSNSAIDVLVQNLQKIANKNSPKDYYWTSDESKAFKDGWKELQDLLQEALNIYDYSCAVENDKKEAYPSLDEVVDEFSDNIQGFSHYYQDALVTLAPLFKIEPKYDQIKQLHNKGYFDRVKTKQDYSLLHNSGLAWEIFPDMPNSWKEHLELKALYNPENVTMHGESE